jgi:hypothetical protein
MLVLRVEASLVSLCDVIADLWGKDWQNSEILLSESSIDSRIRDLAIKNSVNQYAVRFDVVEK